MVNYTSSYSNLTSENVYESKLKSIIDSYYIYGSSVIVDAEDGKFQITTTRNEIKDDGNDKSLSKLDLTDCEKILKKEYDIDEDVELIILKFFREDSTFQYEVYNPLNHKKLNLSYCENTTLDVYVPFEMSEKAEEIYSNLKEQGYDPLDLNDKFYREICTPYTSENGTDVLLDDREEFIYTSLVNESVCPSGCNYSEYMMDKKYIKCECDTNTTGIETLNLEHLTGKNIGNSFLSTLQTTNWKVMRCYNLVFNFKIFVHNYGSILILILFVTYILFMIYYSFREITPLKVEVSKIVFKELEKESEKEKEKKIIKYFDKKPKEKNKNKAYAPPKKDLNKSHNKNGIKLLENNNLETEGQSLFIKSRKTKKRKSTQKTSLRMKSSRKNLILDPEEKTNSGSKKTDVDKNKKHKKKYDNFELNNLDYYEACEFDKRSCCRIYISVLMREHIALHTFFSWKDYNLFYIKIEKFFIIFCVDMTMSGLFFVHETMHRKYTEGENFTFVQKIPQLLFTLIVAHILEVILCFLSMTDTQIYQIKNLSIKEKKEGEKILDILDCIKRKIVTFFVFTFILFLFFWYFISAFCAVYQNTQKIFLRDAMISYATSLLNPFFIYGGTSLLRCISLSKMCRKKCCCGCVFKISDIIPFF